jgi:hypothetical protein
MLYMGYECLDLDRYGKVSSNGNITGMYKAILIIERAHMPMSGPSGRWMLVNVPGLKVDA